MTQSKPKKFIKPQTITNQLIDDIKEGRKDFISGQWLVTKKYGNKKVKYVGVFDIPSNGVVQPVVVFSYPKQGEHILDWNLRFKRERQEYLKRERINKNRYPKITEINEDDFTPYKREERHSEEQLECRPTRPQLRPESESNERTKWYEGLSFITKKLLKRGSEQ